METVFLCFCFCLCEVPPFIHLETKAPASSRQTAKYWTETFACEQKSSNDEKARRLLIIGRRIGQIIP